eukprot:2837610-Amphidinium_carterae.1
MDHSAERELFAQKTSNAAAVMLILSIRILVNACCKNCWFSGLVASEKCFCSRCHFCDKNRFEWQSMDFRIKGCRFAGALPERGLIAIHQPTYFGVQKNNISGTLPHSGISAMMPKGYFYLFENHLCGSLPQCRISVTTFGAWSNRFTETIFVQLRFCCGPLVQGSQDA